MGLCGITRKFRFQKPPKKETPAHLVTPEMLYERAVREAAKAEKRRAHELKMAHQEAVGKAAKRAKAEKKKELALLKSMSPAERKIKNATRELEKLRANALKEIRLLDENELRQKEEYMRIQYDRFGPAGFFLNSTLRWLEQNGVCLGLSAKDHPREVYLDLVASKCVGLIASMRVSGAAVLDWVGHSPYGLIRDYYPSGLGFHERRLIGISIPNKVVRFLEVQDALNVKARDEAWYIQAFSIAH